MDTKKQIEELSKKNFLNPARNSNETFEEYKIRRNFNNRMTKKILKGISIWDSTHLKTFKKL